MANVRLAALVFFVCACGAQPADPNAGKCRVAGQVVHFTAGTPLRKVQLRLRRFGSEGPVMGAPGVSNSAPSNYAASTDPQGRFSFDGVQPGVYWLSAERAGYLEQSYGAREPLLKGSPLKLTAGQKRDDIVMKLTPQSFVYGKVGDEDGDIIPNAQVVIYRASLSQGHRKFVAFSQTTSQDDGTFVIGNLAAGRYYLSASPARRDDEAQTVEVKGQEAYTTTYYPGVPDAGSAGPVELTAGADVRGLEIRLRLAHTYRIRGKAVNTVAGGPASQVYLRLTPRDEVGDQSHTEVGVMTGNDGSFEYRDVAPGDYSIASSNGMGIVMSSRSFVLSGGSGTVELTPPPAGPLMGRAAVHVGSEDVENVVVSLGEGALVTGSIHIVGSDPAKPSPWPAFMLAARNGDNDSPALAEVAADGTFRIPHIPPNRYAIEMDNLPDGMYVKSVRFEGRDVAGDDLDLTSGGGVLELSLSLAGAAIAGVVRGADGEPAAGATVQVCSAGDSVKYANADENGNYKVDGLAPGDYQVLAWEEPEQSLTLDASFRSRFEAQSAAVKLAEGGHTTADLKLISREAIEAEAAKLK